jgi:hypothetical protein
LPCDNSLKKSRVGVKKNGIGANNIDIPDYFPYLWTGNEKGEERIVCRTIGILPGR